MTTLREARPEDAAGVRELFQLCHGREFPSELWRWQYADGPRGPALADAAVRGSAVIGHLASLPVRLERGPESVDAALWVDLMVHPAHRDLDTFLDLAEAHRAHCQAQGKSVLFAFPNDRSYPLLKRLLDWQPIEEIDALEAPLAGLPAAAVPQDLALAPCARFTGEFDAFWERVRPARAWCVRRDAAHLDWRYRRKPGADYKVWSARDASGRLQGWLAAKMFTKTASPVGDILDLWTEEPGCPAEAGLWARALDWFRERGAARVSAWALKGSALSGRFRGYGLERAGPRTHFAGRWAAQAEGKPFPAQGPDWQVAKGDSDVF